MPAIQGSHELHAVNLPHISRFCFLLACLLLCVAPVSSHRLTHVQAADHDDVYNSFGYSVSAADDVIAVGAPEDSSIAPNGGSVYLFAHDGTEWTQDSKLLPESASVASYGAHVAVSRAYLFVASEKNIFIYNRTTNLELLDSFEADASDNAVTSLTLSAVDDTLVYSCDGGGLHVFTLADSHWGLAQSLSIPTLADNGLIAVNATSLWVTLSDATVHEYTGVAGGWSDNGRPLSIPAADAGLDGAVTFGHSVAFWEGRVLVSAPNITVDSMANAGAVYVFEWDSGAGAYAAVQTLTHPTLSAANFMFGQAIAVSGNVLAVSCSYRQSAVSFQHNSTSGLWEFLDEAADPVAPVSRKTFGQAVAAGASAVAVGMPGYEFGTGAVFLLEGGCSPGYFSDWADCTACPEGTFTVSGVSCVNSSVGFTSSTNRSSEVPCNDGFFSDSVGTDCTPADADHYVPADGLPHTSQDACPAGTQQPFAGQSACYAPITLASVDAAALTGVAAHSNVTLALAGTKEGLIAAANGTAFGLTPSVSGYDVAAAMPLPGVVSAATVGADAFILSVVGTAVAVTRVGIDGPVFTPSPLIAVQTPAGPTPSIGADTASLALGLPSFSQNGTVMLFDWDGQRLWTHDAKAGSGVGRAVAVSGSFVAAVGADATVTEVTLLVLNTTDAAVDHSAVMTYTATNTASVSPVLVAADDSFVLGLYTTVSLLQRDTSTMTWAMAANTTLPGASQNVQQVASISYNAPHAVVGCPSCTEGEVTGVAYTMAVAGSTLELGAAVTAAPGPLGSSVLLTPDAMFVGAPHTGTAGTLYYRAMQCDAGSRPSSAVGCAACDTGSYSAGGDDTACHMAAAGYYVADSDKTKQVVCDNGHYQPSTGQSSCVTASIDHYVPADGRPHAVQDACPAGTQQLAMGQAACVAMANYTYLAADARCDYASSTSCTNMRFGQALATVNNTLLVGAPYGRPEDAYEPSGANFVEAWALEDGAWVVRQTLQPVVSAYFGFGLAVSGDTLAVAAPMFNEGTGAVFMYAYNATLAEYANTDVIQGIKSGDSFGYSLAFAGDSGVLVVGAPNAVVAGQPCVGAVFTVTGDGGLWAIQTKIEYPGIVGDDEHYFGQDIVAAGASFMLVTSAETLFMYNVSGLTDTPVVVATLPIDNTGNTIAVAGTDTALVTAFPYEDSYTGVVAVFGVEFDTDSHAIALTEQYTIEGPAKYSHFGSSVALLGDLLLVGSVGVGQSHLYRLNSTAGSADLLQVYNVSDPGASVVSVALDDGFFAAGIIDGPEDPNGLGQVVVATGCPAGTQPDGDFSTCTACPAGTFSLAGFLQCVSANEGYRVDNGDRTRQVPCNNGQYQPEAGQTECIAADPGFFVPADGGPHTVQTICPAGSTQPAPGQPACLTSTPGWTALSTLPEAPGLGAVVCTDGDVSVVLDTSGVVYVMTHTAVLGWVYSEKLQSTGADAVLGAGLLALVTPSSVAVFNTTDLALLTTFSTTQPTTLNAAVAIDAEAGLLAVSFPSEANVTVVDTSWAVVATLVPPARADVTEYTQYGTALAMAHGTVVVISEVAADAGNVAVDVMVVETAAFDPAQSTIIAHTASVTTVATDGATLVIPSSTATDVAVLCYHTSGWACDGAITLADLGLDSPVAPHAVGVRGSVAVLTLPSAMYVLEGAASSDITVVATLPEPPSSAALSDSTLLLGLANSTVLAFTAGCAAGSAPESGIFCAACPPGTYAPAGSFHCYPADPGYYAPEDQDAQLPCHDGQYQPDAGQVACLDSPVGTYVPADGQPHTEFTICAEGTFARLTGQYACFEDRTYVKLTSPTPGTGHTFGYAGAATDNFVLTADIGAEKAFVYTWDSAGDELQLSDTIDQITVPAVLVAGPWLFLSVYSASFDEEGARGVGEVRVYSLTDGMPDWTTYTAITNTTDQHTAFTGFGAATAFDNGTLAVGCPNCTSDNGAVLLYRFTDGAWAMTHNITAPDELYTMYEFGSEVHLKGDTLVVSSSEMYAVIYRYNSTADSWELTQFLEAFGDDDDMVAVGLGEGVLLAGPYIYTLNASNVWQQGANYTEVTAAAIPRINVVGSKFYASTVDGTIIVEQRADGRYRPTHVIEPLPGDDESTFAERLAHTVHGVYASAKVILFAMPFLDDGAGAVAYYPATCPPGTFTSDDLCVPCPAGTYSNATDVAACTPASIGYMVDPNSGRTGQLPCDDGTYQPEAGQDVCIACPSGYSTPETGAGFSGCVRWTPAAPKISRTDAVRLATRNMASRPISASFGADGACRLVTDGDDVIVVPVITAPLAAGDYPVTVILADGSSTAMTVSVDDLPFPTETTLSLDGELRASTTGSVCPASMGVGAAAAALSDVTVSGGVISCVAAATTTASALKTFNPHRVSTTNRICVGFDGLNVTSAASLSMRVAGSTVGVAVRDHAFCSTASYDIAAVDRISTTVEAFYSDASFFKTTLTLVESSWLSIAAIAFGVGLFMVILLCLSACALVAVCAGLALATGTGAFVFKRKRGGSADEVVVPNAVHGKGSNAVVPSDKQI
ncbi:GCC2 and GCC3 [Carpediemonas membranifera]|uniref:GCC2 and GCC3 n=1 Tax=Carpediemonas membranifera TaxID=201153 RepID=A0A8J6ATV7_9EUKA|nr:GCC2 and GCC3 [Carpediemonas membranifera]|eukprot:KAG9394471.1 GCC2 and GCC3 [Carpediemonas membranifera]